MVVIKKAWFLKLHCALEIITGPTEPFLSDEEHTKEQLMPK